MAVLSSTSLCYVRALLCSSRPYYTVLQCTLYHCITLLYHTVTWLYLALLLHYIDSMTHYHGAPWLYYTLPHSFTCMALLDSTTLYHGPTLFYYTLYYILPWLHLYLLHTTMALLGSTSHWNTLHHGSILFLPYGSTWLYTSLYNGSTQFYYTLPWLQLSLVHTTMAWCDSTSWLCAVMIAIVECDGLIKLLSG